MTDKPEPIKKVSIICASGDIESVYATLIMSNGAVMEGIEANLFFTFWGINAITKKKMNKVKTPTIGNPAMPIPSFIGWIPGLSWLVSKAMLWRMNQLDIPPVSEFLDMIKAGGAKVYCCKAAFDMFMMKESQLWEGVDGVITVGDFYEKSAGGQIIFT
jgi:peroxiredoxin family protein